MGSAFQHTAARRRLGLLILPVAKPLEFQHTAARRRLVPHTAKRCAQTKVSTHSRPKAAGVLLLGWCFGITCFNTQPPEGGWSSSIYQYRSKYSFNTQPPEGGWSAMASATVLPRLFQHTAARRRLDPIYQTTNQTIQFQHTAARRRLASVKPACSCTANSFNTQPPEGGWFTSALAASAACCCFNTQPPEGGWSLSQKPCSIRFRSPDFAKLPRKARTRV